VNADPSKFYGELVDAIDDHDLRTVARLMSYHVGEEQAITLQDLALLAFGEAGETSLRKTREVLAQLIEDHGFPVCSNSGKAGRWLAGTKEEALEAARERESRAEKLLASAKKLRMARLPAGLPKFDGSKQPGLGI
jgi:hypothetical protein